MQHQFVILGILSATLFLVSCVIGCTKEGLYEQIGNVTLSLDEMAQQLEQWIKSEGKNMDKNKLNVLEKCNQDIKKFRAAKEDIRKNVDAGTMTVDDGCKEAAELAEKFVRDINEVEKVLKSE